VAVDYSGVSTSADARLGQAKDLREDVGETCQWLLVFCG
jgi:hypothetical protein